MLIDGARSGGLIQYLWFLDRGMLLFGRVTFTFGLCGGRRGSVKKQKVVRVGVGKSYLRLEKGNMTSTPVSINTLSLIGCHSLVTLAWLWVWLGRALSLNWGTLYP